MPYNFLQNDFRVIEIIPINYIDYAIIFVRLLLFFANHKSIYT